MKLKLFISSVFLALFALMTSSSFSQSNDCCDKEKTSQCCVEKKDCCESTGNAGGDSSVASKTCLVSGEEIGEGQGVGVSYYGKNYTLCCEGCLAKFKKEPMNYIKDEMTCPVMGDKIESKDVFAMHDGTKYYLCCKSCLKKFENDPEKYKNGYKE